MFLWEMLKMSLWDMIWCVERYDMICWEICVCVDVNWTMRLKYIFLRHKFKVQICFTAISANIIGGGKLVKCIYIKYENNMIFIIIMVNDDY